MVCLGPFASGSLQDLRRDPTCWASASNGPTNPGRRILSDALFFSRSKFKVNENWHEFNETCIDLNEICNDFFRKNPNNYDTVPYGQRPCRRQLLLVFRDKVDDELWLGLLGLMTPSCGWS
jgi:hypothetical protein